MTDNERLLEIATRLLGKGSLVIIDNEIVLAFDAAERILKTWRERTGAREERGQDVSDALIRRTITILLSEGYSDLADVWIEIQRARAAGKGEG